MLVALVGGLLPALTAALLSFLLLNWNFTPPVGRFTIAEPANLLALLVYVAVAAGVATVVDRASRRAADATRARTEAATMGSLSRSVLTGQDTAEAIVERLREVFGQRAVSLLAAGRGGGWVVLAASGEAPACAPDEGDTRVTVDDRHVLVLCGDPLRASDQRVLEAFAVQASLVLEYRRLREREDRAAALESADATRTAILRAVSHDLRTPLATLRTAVDGLVADRDLDAEDRHGAGRRRRLLGRAARARSSTTCSTSPGCRPGWCTRSSASGASTRCCRSRSPVSRRARCTLEVDESTPMVHTDAGLLERVVANLVSNAVRVSAGTPVRVLAHVLPDTVDIMVVDRGPGVRPEQRERMFEPFQRLSDRSPGGPRARAGGRARADRGDRRHPVGRGHPRRRADHGALAAAHPALAGRRVSTPTPSRRSAGSTACSSSTTSRRWPGPSRSTCARTGGRSSPRPTVARRSTPPRPPTPTSSCSTSGCPTSTAPR